jgi:hypothetical protein
MEIKKRNGTLVQIRLNNNELDKLDKLANEIGGVRTTALKFLIARINKLEIGNTTLIK